MMMPDRKRLTGWLSVAGLLLLAVLAFSQVDPALAERSSEDIIDGRNPGDFKNRGQIDRIGGDTIVINDTQKRLASDVKYYRPGRIGIPKDAFEEGSTVGYITNRKGEIISLWLLGPSHVNKGLGRGQGGGADHSDERGGKGGRGE